MAEPFPLLSVVIPTLGRPTLLPTLRSLLALPQAARLEIFVVGGWTAPDVDTAMRELLRTHPQVRHLPLTFARGDSSEKKNAGWRAARGEVVAFVDDDVRVRSDWAERLLEPFADPSVGLVSGPSLVPEDIGLMPWLAGQALASGASGYVAERYRARKPAPRRVTWSAIIGCNMAFRRSVLEAIGGFDPRFWPGEEMIASFQATVREGHSLVFHPGAALYHYPRQSFPRFCRQIFGYGATRVRLMRAGVALEITPLAPALWLLGNVALLSVAWHWPLALRLFAGLNAAYLLLLAWFTAQKVVECRRLKAGLVFLLMPVMHLCYGAAEWYECLRPNRDWSEAAAARGDAGDGRAPPA